MIFFSNEKSLVHCDFLIAASLEADEKLEAAKKQLEYSRIPEVDKKLGELKLDLVNNNESIEKIRLYFKAQFLKE